MYYVVIRRSALQMFSILYTMCYVVIRTSAYIEEIVMILLCRPRSDGGFYLFYKHNSQIDGILIYYYYNINN